MTQSNHFLPGLNVPLPLVQLKTAIIEHGGLAKEGIFRIAGHENTISQITRKLSEKTFSPNDREDIHSMATIIKVRE